MEKKYDYIVIGSGPAGHASAIKAAQLGLRTAVIEKHEHMLGGVCLNEGCIPAKSLYYSAHVFELIKSSADLCGIDIDPGNIGMDRIVKKSRDHVEQLCKGLSFLFKKHDIDIINGSASFLDKNTVRVSPEQGGPFELNAEKFLIATGSSPRALDGAPFDGKHIINSSDAIRTQDIPGKILIVGGGAIGSEFASFFNAIGSETTIVEAMGAIIPGEDMEISKQLNSLFRKKDINVLTSSSVKSIVIEGKSVKAVIRCEKEDLTETFDKVLVSIGRAPSFEGLGLENIGLVPDNNGFIAVDQSMRTGIDNVYAAGDIINTPMLAYTASAEGELAACSAAGRAAEPIKYDCVPNVIFTATKTASVGLTEAEVRSKNLEYVIGKAFFKANGRAVVNSQPEGFVKIIVDPGSFNILGAHIIGYEAAETIHEFVIALNAGITAKDIALSIHAHPTFAEAVADACKSACHAPSHSRKG